jgi:hypothetical protein
VYLPIVAGFNLGAGTRSCRWLTQSKAKKRTQKMPVPFLFRFYFAQIFFCQIGISTQWAHCKKRSQ